MNCRNTKTPQPDLPHHQDDDDRKRGTMEGYELVAGYLRELEARISALERAKESGQFITQKKLSMTSVAAADALGLSRQTIHAMIRDGRLKANIHGRPLTASVEEYLKRHGRKVR